MKAALIATWTQPVAGREQKALEYGAEVMAHWSGLAQQGKCTEPEIFFAETGVGMWMVKGDRATLMAESEKDVARLLVMKGDLLLKDFALVLYHTGDAADAFMATYGQALASIS
jgi:2-methylcitrate dehydratase PrpD